MKLIERMKSNVGPYKAKWFFVRDSAPYYREFRTGGELIFNSTPELIFFMATLSNTVFVTAIHPLVVPTDDLSSMAQYLLTISAPTRYISILIKDDRLRSVGYIGKRRSIGVPRSSSGGAFVAMPPPQPAPTTSVASTKPLLATTMASSESSGRVQDMETTPPVGVSKDRTPEDGENTESNPDLLHKFFFGPESLQDISQPEVIPTSGGEKESLQGEITETVLPTTKGDAPGFQASEPMQSFFEGPTGTIPPSSEGYALGFKFLNQCRHP